MELIGEENFKMSPRQMEEVIDVLRKEDILEDANEKSSSSSSSVPQKALESPKNGKKA